MICGPDEFISEARRNRKILGGGMRQCGIIAAAGIIALEQMTERLTEDHANARRLAEGIAEIPGLSLEPENVKTNIIYFNLKGKGISAGILVTRLSDQGIKILQLGPAQLRAVTHYGISSEDIETTLTVLRRIMEESD